VTDDQQSEPKAYAQQNEPCFVRGMFWIRDESRVFVEEGAPGLFERNPVLRAVSTILELVPFESKLSHTYIVTTT
jgi:hypothetical protein